jgi:hypothetical protein
MEAFSLCRSFSSISDKIVERIPMHQIDFQRPADVPAEVGVCAILVVVPGPVLEQEHDHYGAYGFVHGI